MATLTLSEIARLCDATLEGGGGDRTVVGPATLSDARADEVSFLGNPRYQSELESTDACAVLVPEGLTVERSDLALLRCSNPSRAFTRVIEAFRPPEDRPAPGVHPSAAVDPTAELGADVVIGAGEELAVVEAMKMENLLRAEKDGTVHAIHARPGDSLAVDQAILEFE